MLKGESKDANSGGVVGNKVVSGSVRRGSS